MASNHFVATCKWSIMKNVTMLMKNVREFRISVGVSNVGQHVLFQNFEVCSIYMLANQKENIIVGFSHNTLKFSLLTIVYTSSWKLRSKLFV